jgi:uncharacterized protein YbaR (Trm112 family)
LKSPHIVGLFCPYSRSHLTLVWSTQEQERALKLTDKELTSLKQESPHIVGLFCPYSRSLLTLVCSTSLKQDMFKASQELFALRKDEANLIAEISGAQSADRNLRDMIKTLDAERYSMPLLTNVFSTQLTRYHQIAGCGKVW